MAISDYNKSAEQIYNELYNTTVDEALNITKPKREVRPAFWKRTGGYNTTESPHNKIGYRGDGYQIVSGEVVVGAFEGFSPMDSGTLMVKPEVADLLSGVLADRYTEDGYNFLMAGLMYEVPDAIGIRQYRTSVAGLDLLNHWNKTYKKFRPFHDCYVRRHAVKTIRADCSTMALGLPAARFEDTYAAIETYNKALNMVSSGPAALPTINSDSTDATSWENLGVLDGVVGDVSEGRK